MDVDRKAIQTAIKDINNILEPKPKLNIIGKMDFLTKQVLTAIGNCLGDDDNGNTFWSDERGKNLAPETIDVYKALIKVSEPEEDEPCDAFIQKVGPDDKAPECVDCSRREECAELAATNTDVAEVADEMAEEAEAKAEKAEAKATKKTVTKPSKVVKIGHKPGTSAQTVLDFIIAATPEGGISIEDLEAKLQEKVNTNDMKCSNVPGRVKKVVGDCLRRKWLRRGKDKNKILWAV